MRGPLDDANPLIKSLRFEMSIFNNDLSYFNNHLIYF